MTIIRKIYCLCFTRDVSVPLKSILKSKYAQSSNLQLLLAIFFNRSHMWTNREVTKTILRLVLTFCDENLFSFDVSGSTKIVHTFLSTLLVISYYMKFREKVGIKIQYPLALLSSNQVIQFFF